MASRGKKATEHPTKLQSPVDLGSVELKEYVMDRGGSRGGAHFLRSLAEKARDLEQKGPIEAEIVSSDADALVLWISVPWKLLRAARIEPVNGKQATRRQ